MQINLYNESLFGDGGGDTPANIQPVKSVTITENGTMSVAPDAGFDGLEGVSIETNVAPKLQTKSVEVTQNGTTSVAPDAGFDGLEGVSIETNVESPLVEKDVNFYDIDGTLLYSYTAAEFNSLTEFPPYPKTPDWIPGVVFDQWSNTRRTSIRPGERIDIGALFRPADDSSVIMQTTPSVPGVSVKLPVWGAESIDWGDGTVTVPTDDVVPSHAYADYGTAHTIKCRGTVTYRSGYSSSNPPKNSDGFNNISKLVLTTTGDINRMPPYAFMNCMSLELVAIPNNMKEIGMNAFSNTPLRTIIIPIDMSVYTANTAVYDNCRMLKLAILHSYITDNMLRNTGLDHIAFRGSIYPSGLQSSALRRVWLASCSFISNRAFYNCYYLEKIHIASSSTIRSSGQEAFQFCYNLRWLDLSEFKLLGTGFFRDCIGLERADVPEGITSIPKSCFSGCYGLRVVDLPATITSIGDFAFSTNYSLASFIIRAATPPTLSASAFTDLESLEWRIYVPDASVEAYKSATNWVTLADRIHPMSEIGL